MASLMQSTRLGSVGVMIGGPTVAAPRTSIVRRPRVVRSASEPTEKSLDIMRKFSEQYAKRTGTFFCADLGVTAVVIKEVNLTVFERSKIPRGAKGLAEHKDSLGAPLCPCRHYDDKQAEVEQGFWNCPCVPMRERKECHCMLFLTEDNDFAGQGQEITLDEIREGTAGF